VHGVKKYNDSRSVKAQFTVYLGLSYKSHDGLMSIKVCECEYSDLIINNTGA
jgi:hypothetical protein